MISYETNHAYYLIYVLTFGSCIAKLPVYSFNTYMFNINIILILIPFNLLMTAFASNMKKYTFWENEVNLLGHTLRRLNRLFK